MASVLALALPTKRYIFDISVRKRFTPVKGKARVLSRSDWIEEARARTGALHSQGPQGPVVWVYTQDKSIPNGTIATGQENGHNLYSIRAFYEVLLLRLILDLLS